MLKIGGTRIKNFASLGTLASLRHLDMSDNCWGTSRTLDISILTRLADLEYVDISFAHIEDLTHLADLTKLRTLKLGYNNIKDTATLGKLKKLEFLDLCNNEIENVAPLMGLENLRKLDIENNPITEISLPFLDSFPRLEEIRLNRNFFPDLDYFAYPDRPNDLRKYLAAQNK